MKYKIILLLNMALLFAGCTDILDIEPNNKVVADKVLITEEGIAMHMANLYGRLPIEDFSYAIDKGFNLGIGNTDPNNGGRAAAMYCDEAMHSEFDEWGSEGFNFWERYTDDKGLYNASVGIYTLIRDINNLLETIPTLNTSNNKKTLLEGEAAFLRAYTYFALAKRYGGVSIIKKVQVYNGDVEELKVPRSTEKDTWDFILSDCDDAIRKLSESSEDTRRANKWIALALKSRAALYAASIAKYTHEPYVGQSGYYCLILTDFLAEFETKCGRVYCDYCDGTLISYRPDTVCVEIPAPCLWMVAFHPDLFKGKMLEKTIEEYTFFSYALKEALHVSLKEKRILSSCVDDIRREFHHGADSYKRTILIRHITRLLDYTTRFYERQFIVRELNNELLIRQYEKLVKQYIGDGKLAQKPLTSAYCAGQLHLSEAYFNDLLELQLGHTHSCHLQLKRIEMAKEKLRSSGESLSQIVHELGFPSIQYFSFLFKKITGITPNSYRSLN